MNRPSVDPLGVAVLICVCVVVFVPIVFQGRDAGLAKWVYDYQTLIGGLFAIAAAYVTVVHMRASDFDNDDRHRELISLSLRSDRLRVDRAFSRASVVRRDSGIAYFSVDILPDDDDDERAKKMLAIIPNCDGAAAKADAFRTYLERPEASECADLFDGEMQSSYEDAMLAAGSILGLLQTIKNVRNAFGPEERYKDARYVTIRNAAIDKATDRDGWNSTFDTYNSACERFFDHAERLHSAYMKQKYGQV